MTKRKGPAEAFLQVIPDSDKVGLVPTLFCVITTVFPLCSIMQEP